MNRTPPASTAATWRGCSPNVRCCKRLDADERAARPRARSAPYELHCGPGPGTGNAGVVPAAFGRPQDGTAHPVPRPGWIQGEPLSAGVAAFVEVDAVGGPERERAQQHEDAEEPQDRKSVV